MNPEAVALAAECVWPVPALPSSAAFTVLFWTGFLLVEDSVLSTVMASCLVVLVYKCGQEKLNNLYYQMKEQRR